MKKTNLPSFVAALVAALITISACGTAVPQPTATITAPTSDTVLIVGQSTPITGKVTGAAVKQVDIYVDGIKYATLPQSTAPNEFAVNVPWTPDLVNTHVLQIKGVNTANEVLTQASVIVSAKAPVSGATSAPGEATVVATVPAVAQPTVASTAGPVAKPTEALSQLTVTNDFVRVRSGPATSYTELGQLKQNDKATVKGKSADGNWFNIDFNGKDGWVFGELVKFDGDASKLPVVQPAKTVADTLPAATSDTTKPASVVKPALLQGLATAPPVEAPPAAAAASATVAPAALLPYRQNMRFYPRDNIGDVPLGYNGEGQNSALVWEIDGARSAELEITTAAGGGTYAPCPVGDMGSVSLQSAVGKRMAIQLPIGKLPFSIGKRGFYLFTIYVTKTDGSQTYIPRAVIVDCFKTS